MADISGDFEFLIGEPVNAVQFVMDYVEIHLNGSYLRCFVPPVVHRAGRAIPFPQVGSRDALCQLIEDTVMRVRVIEGHECRVTFASETELSIALTPVASHGREALHYQKAGASSFGVL